MRVRSIFLVATLSLAVVGCATQRESVPARLDLSVATCGGEVQLAGAMALMQEKKDGPFKATARIGDTAPCVTDQGGARSTYHVFALPGGDGAMMATVVSVPLGGTIFTPRLQFRGSDGAITRDVGRDAFLFSGNTLQVQLRLRAGESFVVVLSDSATVGQTVTNIASSTSAAGVPVGGGYVPIYTGREDSAKLTFAHNGEVVVIVGPIPDAEKR
jgi:hypothetical protein